MLLSNSQTICESLRSTRVPSDSLSQEVSSGDLCPEGRRLQIADREEEVEEGGNGEEKSDQGDGQKAADYA